jgi:hypothetical protein
MEAAAPAALAPLGLTRRPTGLGPAAKEGRRRPSPRPPCPMRRGVPRRWRARPATARTQGCVLAGPGRARAWHALRAHRRSPSCPGGSARSGARGQTLVRASPTPPPPGRHASRAALWHTGRGGSFGSAHAGKGRQPGGWGGLRRAMRPATSRPTATPSRAAPVGQGRMSQRGTPRPTRASQRRPPHTRPARRGSAARRAGGHHSGPAARPQRPDHQATAGQRPGRSGPAARPQRAGHQATAGAGAARGGQRAWRRRARARRAAASGLGGGGAGQGTRPTAAVNTTARPDAPGRTRR